ncbi:hypothetical protein [Bacillus sp. SRB3LM]|uniref:hypothetical protein n=1 Tax=Bacillus sp. SRB3LM TaxID=2608689 RepID=UPI0018C369CF|nr:hypothetical protein [Bacillus sp. SRB3LM]MBG0969281.1 hypothetical protein [Bacillus sp. SRB3LM]MBG0973330.1 hypothetical protein [Bacillus sp. SRB3LM]
MKKSIPNLLVGGMVLLNGTLVSQQAFADTLDGPKLNLPKYQYSLDTNIGAPSKPMLDFMIKLSNSGALDELEYASNSKVVGLKHDLATIQSMYQFTDEEMVFFKKFFNLLTTLD